eukprot:6203181-Pleurochrysis_carterae.AAC.4
MATVLVLCGDQLMVRDWQHDPSEEQLRRDCQLRIRVAERRGHPETSVQSIATLPLTEKGVDSHKGGDSRERQEWRSEPRGREKGGGGRGWP